MTNDMVLLNSPKTPSRLRRSETGELQRGAFELQRNTFASSAKLPSATSTSAAALTMPSHLLSASTNDLYRTPTKLVPSSSGGISDKNISGLNLETGLSGSPRSGSASALPLSQRIPATSSSALLSHHMPYTTAAANAPHTSHGHLRMSQSRRDSAPDFDADGSSTSGLNASTAEDEGWKAECAKLESDLEEATNRGEPVAQANIAWKLGMLCKNNGAAIKALSHLAASKEALDKLDPFLYEDLDYTPQYLHYQMGLLSRVVQDIPQAQIFFKDAIKLALQDEDRHTLMLAYQEMGYCLFKLEQWLQALDYFNSYLSELVARYSDKSKSVATSSTSPSASSMKFSTPPTHSRVSSSNTAGSSSHSIGKPIPTSSAAPGTPPIPEDKELEPSSSEAAVASDQKTMTHDDYDVLAHTCYNIAYACHKLNQVALAEKFCRRYESRTDFDFRVFALHSNISLIKPC